MGTAVSWRNNSEALRGKLDARLVIKLAEKNGTCEALRFGNVRNTAPEILCCFDTRMPSCMDAHFVSASLDWDPNDARCNGKVDERFIARTNALFEELKVC
jgi:hypothetical protein